MNRDLGVEGSGWAESGAGVAVNVVEIAFLVVLDAVAEAVPLCRRMRRESHPPGAKREEAVAQTSVAQTTRREWQ